MNYRALVLGSEGFVGKHLRPYLLDHGWEVLGADRHSPEERTDHFQCDISDSEQVEALFEWAGDIGCVFHLAGITFIPEAERDPGRLISNNLVGSINVATTLLRRVPSARLINISSSETYGMPRSLPIDEEHPLWPRNPYAIAKAAFEQYCSMLRNNKNLDVVTIRPFNHSGPGQRPDFVLPSFARQIALIEAGRHEPMVTVGNLSAVRDFLHVDDVVRAYELAARQAPAGETYNVCSGEGHSIRETLDRLRDLSRVDVEVKVDPARLRAIDIPAFCGRNDKIARELGWKPKRAFDELLADLLEYWRARVTEGQVA
ncbi:MAG: GDP-mannose 4,6-dehydratase [FCB group bacterium]|jgi:GDP-4-dehydro-6-deoxy-D-mannose reductase|nr:GDP-mannose 4,6-dehydratase [FCB group bacterium]